MNGREVGLSFEPSIELDDFDLRMHFDEVDTLPLFDSNPS